MSRTTDRSAGWPAACLALLISPPVDVSLDARPTLYYYLECATGGLSCSQADVRALLGEIFGRESASQLEARWASVLDKYTIEAQLRAPPAGADSPDLEPAVETLALRARIEDVLFAGGEPERVREKLEVILTAAEARAVEAEFDAAWPAFAQWWSGHEAGWRAYAARLEDLLRGEAAPVIAAAERMYGHAAGAAPVVHLLPVPVAGPVNRAFQKGSRSFVEFRPDDDAAARVAVMLHEYCHVLFDTAPPAWRRARMEAFAAAAEPSAASAFAVMNEALASAIGNGLFMKAHLDARRYEAYAARRESFYANAAVDAAAKAALPLVERYARAGSAMDRAFFDEYFRRTQAAFADDPADPRIALGVSQFYYTQDSLERLAVEATSRYGFASVYFNRWSPERNAETIAYRFPALPVALVATESDYRPALEGLVPGADLPVVDGRRSVSCKRRRPGGGWVYVFVVDPDELMLDIPARIPDCSG